MNGCQRVEQILGSCQRNGASGASERQSSRTSPRDKYTHIEIDPLEVSRLTSAFTHQCCTWSPRQTDSQFDHDPISRPRSQSSTTALGFPTVSHVDSTPREDEVPTPAKVLITLSGHRRTPEYTRQIDGACAVRHDRWYDSTVGAEATETAVGVHGQLEMSDGRRRGRELEQVSRRGSQGSDGQELMPLYRYTSACVVYLENGELTRGLSSEIMAPAGTLAPHTSLAGDSLPLKLAVSISTP